MGTNQYYDTHIRPQLSNISWRLQVQGVEKFGELYLDLDHEGIKAGRGAIQAIEAALYSSDVFLDESAIADLRIHLQDWECKLKESEKAIAAARLLFQRWEKELASNEELLKEAEAAETSQPGQWVPKIGDRVKVKKPSMEHWLDNWPLWVTDMDEYDGLVSQVQSIVRGDRVRFEEPKEGRTSNCIGGGFYYHFDWLEPAETQHDTTDEGELK